MASRRDELTLTHGMAEVRTGLRIHYVTAGGGPKTIVRDGQTGRVVEDAEFASAVVGVLGDPQRHVEMRQAARAHALTMSWDAVFEGVYAGYEALAPAGGAHY